MKLIVGLGNPGEKYAKTRHNVGFIVVDKIVTSNKAQVTKSPDKLLTCYLLPLTKIILAKPQTYMNSSGIAVKKLMIHFKIKKSDLWVIHDDLDLPLESYKIQKGIGPKVHYGVNSIEKELGTKNFWRVRIGVDNRLKKFSIFNFQFSNRISGEEYVLQNFSEEELEILEEVIERVVKDLMLKVVRSW